MKRGAIIALMLGLALFIGLVVHEGIASVADALAAAGWGLLVVVAYHLLPLLLDSGALAVLPPRRHRFVTVLRARWINESVNGLLPVAQMGGPLVMVRQLVQDGGRADQAGAVVTVATTQQMLSQAVFAAIGIVLLAAYAGDRTLMWVLLIGSALFAANATWFYYLQRRGLFARLARMLNKVASGRDWLDLTGGAEALDVAVQSVYRHAGAARASFALNLAGWLAGTGEVWLALYFLGHPVSLMDALFLESLGQAIRGIAFLIPGALGVQEGGYVLLGAMVGVPADTALALSLTKRARELLLGLPGLLDWQIHEGRRLHRAHIAGAER